MELQHKQASPKVPPQNAVRLTACNVLDQAQLTPHSREVGRDDHGLASSGTKPPRRSMQLRRRKASAAASTNLKPSHMAATRAAPQSLKNLTARDSMEAAAASQLPFRPQRELTRQLLHMSIRSPVRKPPAVQRRAAFTAMQDAGTADAEIHAPAFTDETSPRQDSGFDHDHDHDIDRESAMGSPGGLHPAQAFQAAAEHETFGNLLHASAAADSKLFLANASTLARHVPIWHLQRPVCRQRVAAIKATLERRRARPWLPGVLSCFQVQDASGAERRRASVTTAQPHGVIDGQHRLLACSEWLQEGGVDVPLLVQVYPVASAQQVKALFLELNKAETVQEVDLPDALAPPARRIIQAAVEDMQLQYASMFKPSARCHPPHVNAAALRDCIFQSRLHQLGKVHSSSTLLACLRAANSRLAQAEDASWPVRLRGAPLRKARAHGFFIGLDLQRTVSLAEEL